MPVDLDLDVGVQTARNGVRTARIDDAKVPRPGCPAGEVVQPLVELAQRRRLEVDDLELGGLECANSHQTSAFSQA